MNAKAVLAILGEQWLIKPEALDSIIVAADASPADIHALEQKYAERMAGARNATVRDGVAIVPIMGPLFRRDEFTAWWYDGSTYETITKDLRAAVDDSAVKAIILHIDSPGGMVNGVAELSKQIAAVRGVKPIVAYIGGDGASAAYWLASAAEMIVANETSIIGSIGAQIGLTLYNYEESKLVKRYTFTSEQSPMKNASPATDAGSKEYQRLVNELGQVFVDSVAEYRGIKTATVLAKYGQGAVYTGNEALKRGMIDSVSTFEAVLATLSGPESTSLFTSIGAKAMTLKNQAGAEIAVPEAVTAAWVAENFPAIAEGFRAEGTASVDKDALAAEARSAGAQAERDRIAAIEALAMPGAEKAIAECKADPEMTAEKAAVKILQAVRANPAPAPAAAAGAQHIANLKQTEQTVETPAAGGGGNDTPTVEEAAKAAIALARQAGIIEA